MQLHVCGYIWLVSVLFDIVIAITDGSRDGGVDPNHATIWMVTDWAHARTYVCRCLYMYVTVWTICFHWITFPPEILYNNKRLTIVRQPVQISPNVFTPSFITYDKFFDLFQHNVDCWFTTFIQPTKKIYHQIFL